MDKKFEQIYYSDDGYWRRKSAIQKLAKSSGSTKEEAEKWLLKQPLYQIYLPPPKYVPRPNASMSLFVKPNDIHQSDLLSLPHDKFKKKTYKYALNIVDVASRYKGSYQLTTENSKEVAQAFQWIYENTPLTYPKTLIIDNGKEFYGDVTKLMEKHDVMIQRGDPSQHRSREIVERFNRTLADRLFSYQYHKELEDPSKSNREWVSRLQNVVSALNNEKTRLIGMKPVDAIKETLVEQGFSQPAKEYEEKLLDVGTKVRYLYESGELEGYQYKGERRKRSTDLIWSVDVYKIKDRYVQKQQPTLYYLDGGPERSFVFEELQPIQDPKLLDPTLAPTRSALSVLTFKIENEMDLHVKVVSFLKKRYPHSILSAGLGENQDSVNKRINSFKMGYLRGSFDLIVLNLHKHYTAFAIEFKSPNRNGVLSPDQSMMLRQYENNGFKTLVSNDYDHIIEQLIEYFRDVRIKCSYCPRRFISSQSLRNHIKRFHKIA